MFTSLRNPIWRISETSREIIRKEILQQGFLQKKLNLSEMLQSYSHDRGASLLFKFKCVCCVRDSFLPLCLPLGGGRIRHTQKDGCGRVTDLTGPLKTPFRFLLHFWGSAQGVIQQRSLCIFQWKYFSLWSHLFSNPSLLKPTIFKCYWTWILSITRCSTLKAWRTAFYRWVSISVWWRKVSVFLFLSFWGIWDFFHIYFGLGFLGGCV